MAKVSLRAYDREIEAMVDRGQLDEAIAHCQHILKTFPKHLETYRLLGKAYLEYKRFNEAVDIFSRVLAAEPNDFVANVGMSIIRDEQSKMDDAIWHMERAFETQPSNPAIQSELQRLYARRDGVQPPRIRMTRGALAHMYVQGELYPQAISEIKSVLKEDPGRSDMSVLLARAYFRSGQKNQAADEAAAVLRRYPYCLDANRVLVEIASADRPESAHVYRQRVIELDPYAAQVTGSIFETNDVGDNAVALEHLEWNGEPIRTQSDWGTTKAIAPESGAGRGLQEPPQTEPDWMKMMPSDSASFSAEPNVVPPVEPSAPTFDFGAPGEPAQLTPEEEIPEFLRAAGWGKSTGEFDESKTAIDEGTDSSSPAASIEQGDLPDWVKAMAPQDTAEPAQPTEEEELPDWIKNIGTGALASSAVKPEEEQADWLKSPEEPMPSETVPGSSEGSDWLKDIEEPAQPASSSDEELDWLKGLEQPAASGSAAGDDTMSWLQGLDQPKPTEPTPTGEEPDWMKGVEQSAEAAQSSASDDTMSWLKGLDQPEAARPTPMEEGPDWMKGIEETADTTQPSASDDTMSWLKGLDQPEATEPTPTGEGSDWMKGVESQPAASDDSLDWLKGLDQPEAAQPTPTEAVPDWMQPTAEPAAEAPAPADEFDWLVGVGTEPEPASAAPGTEQPDWLTQFGGETTEPSVAEMPAPEAKSKAPSSPAEPPTALPFPAVDAASLGKSEQEQDDSFAWLEALAAKQGASEGLLTKPEERLEEEPEWVKQAKGITKPSAPVERLPAKAEDLGKSEQERDDSFAWLENLAAKQGATEGLLTKPEERREEEPEWVKQAKAETPSTPPAATTPPRPAEPAPVADLEDLGKSEQERDDSFAWLEALAAKQGASEGLLTKPEERLQEEPEWVKQAKSSTHEPAPTPEAAAASVEDLGKSEQEQDDSFAWLEALAAKQGASEGLLTKPEERLEEEPEWVKQAKGITKPSAPVERLPAKAEDLGKSEQERDDSFAWLENLAAEQGATEGLLTQPEDRPKQEPEWIQQAKTAPQSQSPVESEPIDEQPVSSEDETVAWLRGLEQEELKPEFESGRDETAMWFKKLEETTEAKPAPEPEAADDLPSWLSDLEEKPVSDATPAAETTSMWLKSLDEPEPEPVPAPTSAAPAEEDIPSWLQGIEEEVRGTEAEIPEPASEVSEVGQAHGEFDWLNEIEEESAAASPAPATEEEDLPGWLRGVDEENRRQETGALRNLPGWMRDETGEVMAEPTKIEPTRATDWRPADERMPEQPAPEPIAPEPPSPEPQPEPVAIQPPVEEPPKPKLSPKKTRPLEPIPESVPARGPGTMAPAAEPTLVLARNELSRSNIPGALQSYEKLIKKGRFLEDVIFDLREALYRYPVEVSIWQALGDAYMRANRLQDALDAYTKAEELLR
jgi:tetratricopeptide (TPR) repeat protein/uncharacterized protein Smg (DUF494 family)